MPFPGIFRRLFGNEGADPLLRKEIIPPHADTHGAKGSDPITPESIGAMAANAKPGSASSADLAVKLKTPRAIDGVGFDGSAAITHYATCSTAAGTAAKVVSLAGFTLVTGAKVTVRFTVTNTAANPTLNVGGTGAKAIQYRNAAITAGALAANRTYEFVYDGSSWELVGDLDSNTTYGAASTSKAGIVQLSSAVNSTSETQAATPKAAKTAYDKASSAATAAAAAQADADTAQSTATAAKSAAATAQTKANNAYAEATKAASTSAAGRVQLSDAVNSAVSTTAATSKAVKTAYDKGVAAASAAATAQSTANAAKTAAAGAQADADAALLGLVPVGGIVAFSGTFSGRNPVDMKSKKAMTGWCLCDGTATNGLAVPDLRDRMIMGAGTTYKTGAKGGAATHTHSVSGTVGATTLTEKQLAKHGHVATLRAGYYSNIADVDGTLPFGTGVVGYSAKTSEETNKAGGSQSHTHSLSGVKSGSASSLPPYYALAYIMRIA